uniref:Putative secreted protein n=1 Tax=Ixodes ricinus TaxID=34613 RepID=A0A6B0U3H5_IXORI
MLRSTFAWTLARSVLMAWACDTRLAYSSLYEAMLLSSCTMTLSISSARCLLSSASPSRLASSLRSGSTRFSMSAKLI